MLHVWYSIGELPTAETLASRLDDATLATWCHRHGEVRDTFAVRQSLAALVMLRSFWKEGALAYEKTGKPVLIGSAAQCSISHTAGGVFCVLLEEDGRACAPIGADAETAGRFDAARRAALAKRWFTEAEQEMLAAAGGDEATFLRIWTGKEALVKRNGRGLAGIREADTTAVADQGLRLTVVTPGNMVLTVATAAEAETETSIECVEW